MRKFIFLLLFAAAVMNAQAKRYTAARHFFIDKNVAGKPSSPEQINAAVIVDLKNGRISVGGLKAIVLKITQTLPAFKDKIQKKLIVLVALLRIGLGAKLV